MGFCCCCSLLWLCGLVLFDRLLLSLCFRFVCQTAIRVALQRSSAIGTGAARAMSTDKQITVPFTKDIDTHNRECQCPTPPALPPCVPSTPSVFSPPRWRFTSRNSTLSLLVLLLKYSSSTCSVCTWATKNSSCFMCTACSMPSAVYYLPGTAVIPGSYLVCLGSWA